jgi:hypothetical protein
MINVPNNILDGITYIISITNLIFALYLINDAKKENTHYFKRINKSFTSLDSIQRSDFLVKLHHKSSNYSLITLLIGIIFTIVTFAVKNDLALTFLHLPLNIYAYVISKKRVGNTNIIPSNGEIALDPKLSISIVNLFGIFVMSIFLTSVYVGIFFQSNGDLLIISLVIFGIIAIYNIICYILLFNELNLMKLEKLCEESPIPINRKILPLSVNQKIERLSNVIKMAKRVSINGLAELLAMPKKELLSFLIDNTKYLPNFKILDNYLEINQDNTTQDFLSVLDKRFEAWTTAEKLKTDKR